MKTKIIQDFPEKDEPVYIVAGGPSVRHLDLSKLDGKFVVAINRSYEILPNAQMLFWADERFFDVHEPSIINHKAKYKVTGCVHTAQSEKYDAFQGINYYRFGKLSGYSSKEDTLNRGNNSGYSSLCLLLKLGVKQIFLVGYDMRYEDGKSHWHDGHVRLDGQRIIHPETKLTEKMNPYFKTIKPALEEHGVRVVNLNPDSNLKDFEFGDYNELT